MGSATVRPTEPPRSQDPAIIQRPALQRRPPNWLDGLLFFVGIPGCIAVLFSLVGIRLTNGMPYLDALVYMTFHMFIAWWSVSLGATFIKFSFRSWRPPVIAICLLGLLVALIPAAFMFQAIGRLYADIYPVFAANRADLAIPAWNLAYLLHFIRYSIPVLPLFLAGVYGYRFVTGVDWFGYAESNIDAATNAAIDTSNIVEAEASQAKVVYNATAYLIEGTRLPANAKLIAIKAEQHYIKIWSDQGSDLVRYRFRDLAENLRGYKGSQVHRSWWVNLDEVQSCRQSGRKLELLVGADLIVPVSLSYKNAVLASLESK
jgi:hypothetical protein